MQLLAHVLKRQSPVTRQHRGKPDFRESVPDPGSQEPTPLPPLPTNSTPAPSTQTPAPALSLAPAPARVTVRSHQHIHAYSSLCNAGSALPVAPTGMAACVVFALFSCSQLQLLIDSIFSQPGPRVSCLVPGPEPARRSRAHSPPTACTAAIPVPPLAPSLRRVAQCAWGSRSSCRSALALLGAHPLLCAPSLPAPSAARPRTP